MDNSSYFRFDDDDDDDDKTNIYIYLFSQSPQGKWVNCNTQPHILQCLQICLYTDDNEMESRGWSNVQTNECDLQAEKYPIICTHHKLRTNDENKTRFSRNVYGRDLPNVVGIMKSNSVVCMYIRVHMYISNTYPSPVLVRRSPVLS